MPGEPAEYEFFLANLPPSPGQRRLALGIVLALVIAFMASVPFRMMPLPKSGGFAVALFTVLFVNDLVTATLLFAQFAILRWYALLALGSGYLFTSLTAISLMLTFPGAFAPDGLFGAGPQPGAWLYFFWHSGLPLAVSAYALLKGRDHAPKGFDGAPRTAIILSFTAVTAVVCGLTWVSIAAYDVLPLLFIDGIHVTPFARHISVVVTLLSVLALVLLWVRRRSALDLWIMVVLCGWLVEIAFVTFYTGYRFSLGWYTSRIFALVAATIVLLVLLSETTTLYARLARSIVIQRREREGRLTILNAMSASIAHELRQPLGAIMANSDAALQWLAKDPPNFERARSSVERIAGDCHHASDVIATLRALYQKKASQRVLLDVNRIIREVLMIEREELLTRRVSIELQLSEPTPQVFSDRLQLHQVILNLITNALDAMTEVTDRARVLRVRSEIRGSETLIAIEDSGTGIDRKVANQIFEPFYSTKSQGMGLGLWICQTIIQNHNGRLTMSPGRDHGSIFQIVLPGGPQAASGMGI